MAGEYVGNIKTPVAIAKSYFVTDCYDFVAYANRNSVPFKYFYRIPELKTVVSGSLRYDRWMGTRHLSRRLPILLAR